MQSKTKGKSVNWVKLWFGWIIAGPEEPSSAEVFFAIAKSMILRKRARETRRKFEHWKSEYNKLKPNPTP